MFSHRVPMNQLTLLKRFRTRLMYFLSLSSFSNRFGSGCGMSSDMHLASLVIVSQRRNTSSSDQRRTISGRVRRMRCRWLRISARNSMSIANRLAQLFFTADDPSAPICLAFAQQIGTTNTAGPTVIDPFPILAEQLATWTGNHRATPFLPHRDCARRHGPALNSRQCNVEITMRNG